MTPDRDRQDAAAQHALIVRETLEWIEQTIRVERAASGKRGRGKAQATLELLAEAYVALEPIQPASVRAVAYVLFNGKLTASMAKTESTGLARCSRGRENAISCPGRG